MMGRSTSSNLLEFLHFATKEIHENNQVDVLYTDFSKAFDLVDHTILVSKLHNFNLPNKLIKWIDSYLSNRRQFVKYEQKESIEYDVNSGVPQGSHLGPTLFLLFINDIVPALGDNVYISLFADDLKIASKINNTSDVNNLQKAIDNLKNWCEENKLHLNLDKCSIMTISRKREKIDANYFYGSHKFNRANEQRDLGVTFDNKLNFVKHTDSTVAKASSALGFVKRFCYDIREIHTLKSMYSALVQSILEYGSLVWLPYYDVHKNKIESCLRQFSMFALREYPNVSNNYKITSYKTRLENINMHTLQRRRINASILFIFDLLHGNIHCPSLKNEIIVDRNERNLRNIEYFKINDKTLRNTATVPLAQMCKMANKVDELFRTQHNKATFKSKLLALNDDHFSNLAHVSKYNSVFSNDLM